VQSIKSISIDRCPKCNGAWYTADELRLLKDKEAHGDYSWIDVDLWRDRERFHSRRQEHLLCPTDKTELTSVRYGTSRVRVDICTTCKGIWLDGGEYQKIVAYLDKRVNEETVEDFLGDLREEFLDVFEHPTALRSEVGDVTKVLHLLELRFIVQHPNIAAHLRALVKGVPGA
jgi:Zn-finger nucleic acid-binding protein